MTPSDLRDNRALGEDLVAAEVPMTSIVETGIFCWLVALVLTLIVPALHAGDRSWWPWCCGTGAVLGVAGLAYLRRGRGNTVDARPHPLD